MIEFATYMPYIYGFGFVIFFFLLFLRGVHSKTYWGDFVRWFVESIYSFFDDLVPNKKLESVKVFSVIVFFIILSANLGSLIIDMMKMPIKGLDKLVIIPTGDIHFPLLLAVISIGFMLFKQAQLKGVGKTIYTYLPIGGSGIIESKSIDEQGNEKISIGAKIGDICMSMFMGILDIVGLLAKVISLSFRLTGNIFSGGVLMWIAVGGLGMVTRLLIGVSLPIGIPVILILQSLLVGFIQAFVFSLLVSIFINMATEE